MIAEQLGITHQVDAVGSWSFIPRKGEDADGAQIDLLFDRRDDAITICELKYSDGPYTIDKATFRALRRKLRVFRERTGTRKQLLLSFVTPFGVKQNDYADEIVDNDVRATDWIRAAPQAAKSQLLIRFGR